MIRKSIPSQGAEINVRMCVFVRDNNGIKECSSNSGYQLSMYDWVIRTITSAEGFVVGTGMAGGKGWMGNHLRRQLVVSELRDKIDKWNLTWKHMTVNWQLLSISFLSGCLLLLLFVARESPPALLSSPHQPVYLRDSRSQVLMSLRSWAQDGSITYNGSPVL